MDKLRFTFLLNIISKVIQVSALAVGFYIMINAGVEFSWYVERSKITITELYTILLLPILISAVIIIIFSILSDHLKNYSQKILEDLEKRVIGVILSTTKELNMHELASKFELSSKDMAIFIQRLLGEGKLKGVSYDIASDTIMRTSPTETIKKETGAPLREELELMARIAELDSLKEAGKISDKAYDRLKIELERRLAEIRKG